MSEQTYTGTTYLQGPNKKIVNDIVYELIALTGVKLNVLNEHKSFFEYTLYFSYNGTLERTTKFRDLLAEAPERFERQVAKYNEINFSSDTYKVKNVVITENDGEPLQIDIKSSRFSEVNELPREIKKQLDIKAIIKESPSFLNKNISIRVNDYPDKMEKFKNIFLKYIVSDEPIQYKRNRI
jgi:hypothetical protein